MALVIDDVEHRLSILQRYGAVKTGTAASMACRVVTGDLYFQPDGILIAIGTDLPDRLDIARRFTLQPELAARAAEIVGLAGLDGERQRLGVHMRHHQQLAVVDVRDDGGDQAAIVEARGEVPRVLKLGFVV